MMTTGAAITEIVEAYNGRLGQWVSITEIADKTGLTKAQLTEALTELLDDGDFWAEPEVHRHRISDRDREIAPIIGGEARHKICWGY
jgi:hypothetical protein